MTASELSKLLQAERAVRAPAGALDAGLDRLVSALGSNAAPLAVASGPLKLGLSAVPKWVGVGFLIGATGAGITSQVASPTRPAAAPAHVAAAALAPAASFAGAPPQPPTAESAIVPSPDPTPVERTTSRSAAVTSPPAPVNAAPNFDQELRLITAAKREMDGGRPHLALAWLDEHRARFPAGVFTIDREALSILARCQQRRQPELARSFASKYPESPMNAQLSERCAGPADFSTPPNAAPSPGEPTQ